MVGHTVTYEAERHAAAVYVMIIVLLNFTWQEENVFDNVSIRSSSGQR